MSTSRPPLLQRPEDVTAEWLSAALGVTVTGFAAEPVGTGQMGDSFRYRLETEGGEPASVVLKFAAADGTSRATGQALRSYEIEVRFYQEVAATVGIRTPGCYYADVEPATGWFTLVLEDMAPAVQGDQMAGCSLAEARLALEELAKLHAPRWGDPALLELEWLHRDELAATAGVSIIQALFPGFADRYRDRLAPEHLALAERVVGALGELRAQPRGPLTVTHGDYRLDNMLFGTGDGRPPLAVVDWQTASTGPALADASYFLGAGLLPADRRAHEQGLVRAYHGALEAGGVAGYGWDECWTDYRRHSFGGLLMAVAASMLVVRTPRGDDMFMTMAERHSTHALDLAAGEFLEP